MKQYCMEQADVLQFFICPVFFGFFKRLSSKLANLDDSSMWTPVNLKIKHALQLFFQKHSRGYRPCVLWVKRGSNCFALSGIIPPSKYTCGFFELVCHDPECDKY